MIEKHTHASWARRLAVHVAALTAMIDPEHIMSDPDLDQAREDVDRYEFWRAEQNGQARLGIDEEESE